jgi:hypothetical protein
VRSTVSAERLPDPRDRKEESMSRLAWGLPGARRYEVGTDRGVLYPRQTHGVPWNGLVSVTEDPVGGESTPYYYDGIKYLDFIAAEDFQATIEAYTSPPEFAASDGVKALAPGLFATQQPRWPFAFSYRTLIGNDLDQTAQGYKLHLAYNCMASPSQTANKTLGATVDPTTKQWVVHTVPPLASTYKPTAHFVIDSTQTDPAKLAALEDLLYGTEAVDAAMPTQSAVIALLS